jgi:hypothetical protein
MKCFSVIVNIELKNESEIEQKIKYPSYFLISDDRTIVMSLYKNGFEIN